MTATYPPASTGRKDRSLYPSVGLSSFTSSKLKTPGGVRETSLNIDPGVIAGLPSHWAGRMSEEHDLGVPLYLTGFFNKSIFWSKKGKERTQVQLCHWPVHISVSLLALFPLPPLFLGLAPFWNSKLCIVYGKYVSPVLPQPSDSQQQMMFQVYCLLFHLLNISKSGCGVPVNPKGTGTWHHSGLILFAAPPRPEGCYSNPQNVFIRTLNHS